MIQGLGEQRVLGCEAKSEEVKFMFFIPIDIMSMMEDHQSRKNEVFGSFFGEAEFEEITRQKWGIMDAKTMLEFRSAYFSFL